MRLVGAGETVAPLFHLIIPNAAILWFKARLLSTLQAVAVNAVGIIQCHGQVLLRSTDSSSVTFILVTCKLQANATWHRIHIIGQCGNMKARNASKATTHPLMTKDTTICRMWESVCDKRESHESTRGDVSIARAIGRTHLRTFRKQACICVGYVVIDVNRMKLVGARSEHDATCLQIQEKKWRLKASTEAYTAMS